MTAVAPCVANWPQIRLLFRPSMTTSCGPVTCPVAGLYGKRTKRPLTRQPFTWLRGRPCRAQADEINA